MVWAQRIARFMVAVRGLMLIFAAVYIFLYSRSIALALIYSLTNVPVPPGMIPQQALDFLVKALIVSAVFVGAFGAMDVSLALGTPSREDLIWMLWDSVAMAIASYLAYKDVPIVVSYQQTFLAIMFWTSIIATLAALVALATREYMELL